MNLSERFIKGLLKYNLSLEEIKNSKYSYAGGTHGNRHINYFKMMEIDRPDTVSHCVCGHNIIRNFYIHSRKSNDTLILGSCCIKRFIPLENRGRTCSKCGDKHKNRKVNECNNCRVNNCICGKEINYPRKKCDKCTRKVRILGECYSCDKYVSKKYRYCFNCHRGGFCDA